MTVFFCIEDEVSRTVAIKLISLCCSLENEPQELGKPYGGFGYIKKNMAKFANLAKTSYVLIVADLDRSACAPSLRASWLKAAKVSEPLPEKMIFCIAKTEIESWLLADTAGISSFLEVSPAKMKANVEDSVVDAKEYLVSLAKSSSNKNIRDDIVPPKNSSASTGMAYNFRLSQFAQNHWDPINASHNSISLKRAMDRLSNLPKP